MTHLAEWMIILPNRLLLDSDYKNDYVFHDLKIFRFDKENWKPAASTFPYFPKPSS